MTYTTHGHHIAGTDMEESSPDYVARCGGPALCVQCSKEASRKSEDAYSAYSVVVNNPMLRYFAYAHLPVKLAQVGQLFAVLAKELDILLPDGVEKAVAIRKLLDAKDASVRSALDLLTSED